MLVMVVFFIAFRWIHLSTPLIRLFLLVLILLWWPTQEENKSFHAAKLEVWEKKGGKVPFDAFPFELRGMENLYFVDFKKALERDSIGSIFLIEADPGTYVVYGLGNKYSMMECLCLGTVEFTARPGEVTAVGTFLYGRTSERSPYPELAEVTNLGPTFDMDFPLVSMTLRPATASDSLPATVLAMPHVVAQLRAVGPFFEPTAREITRLAPIPGVLAYKRGAV